MFFTFIPRLWLTNTRTLVRKLLPITSPVQKIIFWSPVAWSKYKLSHPKGMSTTVHIEKSTDIFINITATTTGVFFSFTASILFIRTTDSSTMKIKLHVSRSRSFPIFRTLIPMWTSEEMSTAWRKVHPFYKSGSVLPSSDTSTRSSEILMSKGLKFWK